MAARDLTFDGWTSGPAGRARRSFLRLAVVTMVLGSFACDSPSQPELPAEMATALSAAQFSATAGQPVLPAPAVVLRDRNGRPVRNATVTFAVVSGGGTITGESARSDAEGRATVGSWVLGARAGENELQARVPGLAPFRFRAQGLAGPATVVSVLAGDNQSARAGAAVEEQPAVRLSDANGNPVAGAAVTFKVVAGGGSVTGAVAVTDAEGVARVGGWTLGTAAGEQKLAAEAGVATVEIHAVAQPATPQSLVAAAGVGESATVGTATGTPPAVRVVDEFGNPVGGAAVVFAVVSGGGTIAGVSASGPVSGAKSMAVLSGADGMAALQGWTLGTKSGTNSLTVGVVGLTAVTFNAQGRAGAPASAVAVAGDGQSGGINSVVAVAPAVLVRDAHANPVPGVTVTFIVEAGGGSLPSATAATDESGISTAGQWRLGPNAGDNQLGAHVGALGPVSFRATATSSPPTLSVAAGDGQTAVVGMPVAVRPTVIVRDGNGQPMPGVPVTFAVSAGGGAVTGANQVTNAAGVATVDEWKLGPFAMTNRLSAAAAGMFSATFTATAEYPAPGAGGYDIDVRYVGSVTSRQRQAFDAAAARWASVIVGDVPSVPLSLPANACATGMPALNETVDDLLIFVVVKSIDGPGNILGSAGPCYVRSSSGLPILGVITLDAADLDLMDSRGLLDDVVLHEMGHVVGVGTLWGSSVLTGAGSSDPRFTGSQAATAYVNSGGAAGVTGVPVENAGGPGSRDSHWRESLMGRELMTSTISAAGNPLSAITVGSLRDVGYLVSYAAASGYAVAPNSAAVGINATQAAAVPIVETPVPTPIAVDETGRPIGRRAND